MLSRILATFATIALAVPVLAQEAPAPTDAAPTESKAPLIAEVKSAEGTSLGTATANETPSGVMLITIELTGLAAGIHGLHIHETGTCTPPDFESAGGHLAGDKEHGVMSTNGPHPGDLPNIHVPDSGELTVEFFATGLTSQMIADEDGSAIVIHEQPDDYVGQPSGHAGNRLGCGTFAAATE